MSIEEKPKKVYHVNKILQIVLIFIPLINLWAWWRVGKIWKGMGLNVLNYVLSFLVLPIYGLFEVVPESLAIVLIVLGMFSTSIPAIYFMNKWTDERNRLYHKQENKIG